MFTSEQTKQEQYLTWWVTLFPLLPGEVFRQETCVWGVQEEVREWRLPPSSSWWGWKAISWETRWHKEGRLLQTETTLAETVKPLWRDNMLTWLSSVNYCLLTDWRYATLRMCNTSLYIVCHSSPTMRSDGIVCLSLGFGSFESSVMIPAIVKWLASPCNYWTWQYCIQKSMTIWHLSPASPVHVAVVWMLLAWTEHRLQIPLTLHVLSEISFCAVLTHSSSCNSFGINSCLASYCPSCSWKQYHRSTKY